MKEFPSSVQSCWPTLRQTVLQGTRLQEGPAHHFFFARIHSSSHADSDFCLWDLKARRRRRRCSLPLYSGTLSAWTSCLNSCETFGSSTFRCGSCTFTAGVGILALPCKSQSALTACLIYNKKKKYILFGLQLNSPQKPSPFWRNLKQFQK